LQGTKSLKKVFIRLPSQDPIYLHSPNSEHRHCRSASQFSDHTNATEFRT